MSTIRFSNAAPAASVLLASLSVRETFTRHPNAPISAVAVVLDSAPYASNLHDPTTQVPVLILETMRYAWLPENTPVYRRNITITETSVAELIAQQAVTALDYYDEDDEDDEDLPPRKVKAVPTKGKPATPAPVAYRQLGALVPGIHFLFDPAHEADQLMLVLDDAEFHDNKRRVAWCNTGKTEWWRLDTVVYPCTASYTILTRPAPLTSSK